MYPATRHLRTLAAVLLLVGGIALSAAPLHKAVWWLSAAATCSGALLLVLNVLYLLCRCVTSSSPRSSYPTREEP